MRSIQALTFVATLAAISCSVPHVCSAGTERRVLSVVSQANGLTRAVVEHGYSGVVARVPITVVSPVPTTFMVRWPVRLHLNGHAPAYGTGWRGETYCYAGLRIGNGPWTDLEPDVMRPNGALLDSTSPLKELTFPAGSADSAGRDKGNLIDLLGVFTFGPSTSTQYVSLVVVFGGSGSFPGGKFDGTSMIDFSPNPSVELVSTVPAVK